MSGDAQKRPTILYFITKSTWGGASRHVFDLATNLTKRYDVTVALGDTGVLAERLREYGVRTISIAELGRDVHAKKDLSAFTTFYRLLQKEQPDILHLHSPKASGIGACAARIYNLTHRKKIKIITTIHGWTFNEDRSLISKELIKVASWIIIKLSHTVIVLGERELDQVRSWPGVNVAKFKIIKNGIATPSYVARTKAREFLGKQAGIKISRDTLVVGSIGELHHNKGYAYLIEALAGLKHVESPLCIIIGDGEERANLRELIKEKGLEGKVVLVGYIHHASLYLKGFDMFVLPSVKEGLPYVLIEAGKAGLPIIATNVGNISEFIDDMNSGVLIRPHNIREIEESLHFLITHPEKRAALGHAVAHKTSAEYSLSKMIAETVKLYA